MAMYETRGFQSRGFAISEGDSTRTPRAPRDRNDSFSLERMKKNTHTRKKHSRLKMLIPGLVFLQPERGLQKPFSIEIPFRSERLILSILPLEIEFSIFAHSGHLGI